MSCLQFQSCTRKIETIGDLSVSGTKPVSVSHAIHEAAFEHVLTVKADVVEICPDDGCWMVLSDKANLLRVEMEETGDQLPKDWQGNVVTVTGRLQRKLILSTGKGFKEYERVCTENGGKVGTDPVVVMQALRVDLND